MTCPSCGCSDTDYDPARGDTVCTQCGTILQENDIVEELSFVEGSHGSSSMVGTMVNRDGFDGMFRNVLPSLSLPFCCV
jgi:transcription factor IIIB 90 kDa subunit